MKYVVSLIMISSLISCAHPDNTLPDTTTMKLMRQTQDNQRTVEYPTSPAFETLQKVQRIAFVSGVDIESSNKLWNSVQDSQPDLIVLLGNSGTLLQKDLINADTPSDSFAKLDQIHSYTELRYRIPFMSTWSDFSSQPGAKASSSSEKSLAKNNYVKYWNYIPSFQAANRKGLEHSVILGAPEHRVQIIMLDNFYYSEQAKHSKSKNTFIKDWTDGKSLLGNDQWNWLKSELKKEAKFRIIVSPQQIGINTGDYKRWGLLPHERQRFFDLIRSLDVKNFVVVSNGLGYGGISKVHLTKHSPLYDLSVGPNQNFNTKGADQRHLLRGPIDRTNFGIVEISKDQVVLKNIGLDKNVLGEIKINHNPP